MNNIMLSKSSIKTYTQCPYKWKLKYIDKLKEPEGEALIRGSAAHKLIEVFYKTNVFFENGEFAFTDCDRELYEFRELERRRMLALLNNKKDPQKYFFPLFQEKKILNNILSLNGIVDAVYLNDADDEYIVIDYKTGKFDGTINKYRRELAFYKILLDNSKILDKPVKYWGIIFVDHGVAIIEEAKAISIKACWKAIERTRVGIVMKDFKKCPSPLCNWCGYCGKECDAIK